MSGGDRYFKKYQIFASYRYFYGPLPQAWCFAHSILRNSNLTVYVLYYDAMSVMRWVSSASSGSDPN